MRERLTSRGTALRCAMWGLFGLAYPLVPWWLVSGADWFAKAVVCGPMPVGGIYHPDIGPWFQCVGQVTVFGTAAPICAVAAAWLAYWNIKHGRATLAAAERADG